MKKILIVNFIIAVIIFTIGNVKTVAANDSRWDLHFENIEITD